MEIKDIDFTALREPFKAEDIQWRIIKSGKSTKGEYAIVAAYVDNRAIMERLDTIVGIPNWESRFTETVKGMICQLSICGVTKSDGADYTNVEPTKGGISDAMKRAGSQWGIGRYLYSLDVQFATISPSGKNNGSYKDGSNPVYFKWNPPSLPSWALPEGSKTTPEKKAPPKENTYEKDITELINNKQTGLISLIDKDTVTGVVSKIAKEFNVTSLKDVEGFDQAKVILRLRDKLKEIKGDK